MHDDGTPFEAINFELDIQDPTFKPKNLFGGAMEKMVDGTLFQCLYLSDRQQYRVTSSTPVDGAEPLKLFELIERADARRWAEKNFHKGFSTDTAALDAGCNRLLERISCELRKLRQDEIVAGELEAIEGFGSF